MLAAPIPYDTNTKMNPPLREARDRDAMLAGIVDGSVDVIATDHAPHHYDEKNVEFDRAPFGIVGLETAVPICLDRLVRAGVIRLPRLVELMSVNPARILRVPGGSLAAGSVADITVLAPDLPVTIDRAALKSKSKNTPYHGWTFTGGVAATIVGGRVVLRGAGCRLADWSRPSWDSRVRAMDLVLMQWSTVVQLTSLLMVAGSSWCSPAPRVGPRCARGPWRGWLNVGAARHHGVLLAGAARRSFGWQAVLHRLQAGVRAVAAPGRVGGRAGPAANSCRCGPSSRPRLPTASCAGCSSHPSRSWAWCSTWRWACCCSAARWRSGATGAVAWLSTGLCLRGSLAFVEAGAYWVDLNANGAFPPDLGEQAAWFLAVDLLVRRRRRVVRRAGLRACGL